MLRDSRTSIHYGVNFIFAPQPVIDPEHSLGFQSRLAQEKLLFSSVTQPGAGVLQLARQAPPLDIRLLQPGPPVGQLVILAPHPQRSLQVFIEEAESVCEAFSQTWPGDLQVIQRDSTIRALYDVASDHAFKFLWEQRLGCTEAELRAFGRGVAGGGLRFVLPPADISSEEPQIEVKIESFLADPKKLFVDVAMTWSHQHAGERLDPKRYLEATERYSLEEVQSFIEGDGQ